MKKSFATLLILMLIPFSTLWSQDKDSTKIAYNDLKEILVLASKGEKLDSLVDSYELKLEIKEGKITLREDQLMLAEGLIEEQGNLINSQASEIVELKNKRSILRKVLGAAGIIILVETGIILIF